MKKWLWIIGIIFIAVAAFGQTGNMFYASQFPGKTVGDKVAAAQDACSTDTAITCTIVIGPTLAAYPAGTLPTKCAQCVWEDYRTGSPYLSSTGGKVSGSVEATSFSTPTVVNVKWYGAKGDGTTDDSAAFAAAGNAALKAASSGPVELLIPPGKYEVDPLEGMTPYSTGTGYSFFYFPTQNAITVVGDGATLQMKTPAVPYNQQVGIPAGSTFYFNWFYFGGSNNEVTGLTIDNHGNAEEGANNGTSYGAFWGTGVQVQGPGNAEALTITATSATGSTITYSWSLLAPNTVAPAAGDTVTVYGANAGNSEADVVHATIAAASGSTSGTFTVDVPRLNASWTSTPETNALAWLNQPDNNRVVDVTFLKTNGWPVIASDATNTLVANNIAQNGAGFVCDNASFDCVISSNIAYNGGDAQIAINGGQDAGQQAYNSTVTGNELYNNNNGSGIDITAAVNATVGGNTVVGAKNWCVLVTRSGGEYGTTITSELPSQNINVTGNTCTDDNQYDANQQNYAIEVGSAFPTYNTGGTPISYTPGSAASNVNVIGNTIRSWDATGEGVGLLYGVKDGFVNANSIISASGRCTNCASGAARVGIIAGSNQTSDVEVSGNSSNATYTNLIGLQGTISGLTVGQNPGMKLSLASGAVVQDNPGTTIFDGEYQDTDFSTGTYANPFSYFAPNSTVVRNFIGASASPNNSADMEWYEKGGPGSSANVACLGMYGNEQLACVDGTGKFSAAEGYFGAILGSQGVTFAPLSAAGTTANGAAAACATGYTCTQLSGVIALTTGSDAPTGGGGDAVQIAFPTALPTLPVCVFGGTHGGGYGQGSGGFSLELNSASKSDVVAYAGSALTASTTYAFTYNCFG